jgi:acyl-CoA dehydrogenase
MPSVRAAGDEAVRDTDRKRGVAQFDAALFGHIGFAISNAVRSLLMALSSGALRARTGEWADAALLPAHRALQRLVRVRDRRRDADLGRLPEEEGNHLRSPGRCAGIMYLASMVLKHHQNQDSPPEELPIVEWACRELLYEAQQQLHSVLRNFPNRPLAALMRLLIFPRGLTYFAPSDRLGPRVADLVLNTTATRARLARFLYLTATPGQSDGRAAAGT